MTHEREPLGPQPCPYCDFFAHSVEEEIEHMTSRHSDILRQRFAELGERYVGGQAGIIHRAPEREPLLLVRAPITPTREQAIETVRDILIPDLGPAATRVATTIIDKLTRVREPDDTRHHSYPAWGGG